jgi:hypothetical protein
MCTSRHPDGCPLRGHEQTTRFRSKADELTPEQRFWMKELSPFEFERLANTPAKRIEPKNSF